MAVDPVRSRNMAAVRRTDTKPELALRSALHRDGLRFRKDFPIRLDGARARPDIVFTRARIAVFVDGCFWHSCPQHGTRPATNTDYWNPKLERNAARDRRNTEALTSAGWTVIRIWEHDLRTPQAIAEQVLEIRQTYAAPADSQVQQGPHALRAEL